MWKECKVEAAWNGGSVAHHSRARSRHGAWLQRAHDGRGGAVGVGELLPAVKMWVWLPLHERSYHASYWAPTKLGITTRRSCLRYPWALNSCSSSV